MSIKQNNIVSSPETQLYHTAIMVILPLVCVHLKKVKDTLKILFLCKDMQKKAENIWQLKFNGDYPGKYWCKNWTSFDNYYVQKICEKGFMSIAVNLATGNIRPYMYEYESIIESIINIPVLASQDDEYCSNYEWDLILIKFTGPFMLLQKPWGCDSSLNLGLYFKEEARLKYEERKKFVPMGLFLIKLTTTTPFFVRKGYPELYYDQVKVEYYEG